MAHVSDALTKENVNVHRVRLSRWSFLTALKLLICSHLRRRSLVYISYPTEGYGKSLLPFLLAFGDRRRIVLHVHEYGSKNYYCRFLLRRFRSLYTIFFSNTEDFSRYVRDCDLAQQQHRTAGWRVVPTPSNIPVCTNAQSRDSRRLKIVHFGQIRPHKGLEALVDAFEHIVEVPDLDIEVIGGVPTGYEAYGETIRARLKRAKIGVRFNLSPEEISRTLSNAHIGAFGFPDGADERRGSLMAALAHGVLCITTYSQRTPTSIRGATIGIELGDSATTSVNPVVLAQAITSAVVELRAGRQGNLIEAARVLGRRASFHGIACQLLDLVKS